MILWTLRVGATLLLGVALALAGAAFAAMPEAGTIIQNQAAASYEPCLDTACASAAPEETVTSNLVETRVQQVAGLSLTNDQTRPVSPGGLAFLPHQLVNLGNGPDRYELCVENVDAGIATWALFLDADGNGIPDGPTPLVDQSDADGCVDTLTAALEAGVAENFVIEVAVPASAPDGGTLTLDLRATSEFDATSSAVNTDTLTVVSGPVIEITKRLDISAGPSPTNPVRVTLEYRNTGLADATDLVLEDLLALSTASGAVGAMRYVPGSARWSQTGPAVLTDADDGTEGNAPDLVDFCAYDALGSCDDRIRATLSNVPTGASGSIEFEVSIDAGIANDERLLNDVTFTYADATGSTQFGSPVPFRSNTVAFVIIADARAPGVVAGDSRTDATAGDDDSQDAGNVVTVASAEQGERVRFENVIWNAGDGSDLFDLTVDREHDRNGAPLANPFPAGTLFRLLRADGISPLSDTDASGLPDTGTLPLPTAGSCGGVPLYDAVNGRCGIPVVLEAILPGETAAADVPAAGFEVTLRATSRLDGTVTNAVTDRLLAIVDGSVDLTNDRPPDGSAPGEGAGPEATPVTTAVVEAGGIARFVLVVTNTGSVSDAWQLSVSDDSDFANPPFASSPNFAARFLADAGGGDCSSTAAALSQTGTVVPGASRVVCAEVDVPPDAAGGLAVDLYFRVRSATSGVEDVKLDRLVVAEGPAIDLINDESGQAQPGTTVTYSHIVTNVGNVPLENLRFTALPLTENDDGFSLTLYLDADDDGLRSASDPFIEPGVAVPTIPTLAVGESVRIFAVVFAPATGAFGTSNFKTVTVLATPQGGGSDVSDAVTDITTITSGDMTVLKEQALDGDCDGTADGPGACSGESCYQIASFEVIPAQQCVVYRLTAVNSGSTTLFDIHIHDTTQPFTNYLAAAERCEGPTGNCDVDVTAPADGAAGDVTAAIGELAAGEQAQLWFGLRVE